MIKIRRELMSTERKNSVDKHTNILPKKQTNQLTDRTNLAKILARLTNKQPNKQKNKQTNLPTEIILPKFWQD